jgi:L-amino acid N-acyltransferase YncA
MFGSPEKALANGLGYCLLKADRPGEPADTILCAAFAGPAAGGMIELGVETPEPHRRRGYAAVTCAHLIRACEAQGYQTFWNAARDNASSVALARKLGYREEREFVVLAWSQSPTGT